MFTGFPGTGIGGLFYLVTVVPTMVVVEIGRTVVGKGNVRRAKFVSGQAALSLAIVGVYMLTGAVLQRLLPSQTTATILGAHPETVTTIVIAFPFGLLISVLSATQLLRLVLTIHERVRRWL